MRIFNGIDCMEMFVERVINVNVEIKFRSVIFRMAKIVSIQKFIYKFVNNNTVPNFCVSFSNIHRTQWFFFFSFNPSRSLLLFLLKTNIFRESQRFLSSTERTLLELNIWTKINSAFRMQS